MTGEIVHSFSKVISNGLFYSHESNPMNFSVDRIDSSKGYSLENIQLVGQKVNIIKGDLQTEDFVEFCRKVVNYFPINNK
uniref:Zn-finger protein n=1 Tax=Marseillevirus LCMAC101 TaxID=2506602 RepID=A0A481YS87_9VIRU|nr:MAG: Zn-finger protein [Marseillevirus LCMAC101]